MLTTIWMCTQEWSLIFIRATALTLETCHQAFSWASLFDAVEDAPELAVPALGKPDAHAGDRLRRREPRLADRLGRDGAVDALLDLGVERRRLRRVGIARVVGHRSILAHRSTLLSPVGEARELAPGVRERLAEARAVDVIVQPAAGA